MAINVFDPELYECLKTAGVRDSALEKLLEDELDTFEMLEGSTDEFLKVCGLKGGQIFLLRKGLKAYREKCTPKDVSSTATSSPSTPLPTPSNTPLCTTPQSRPSTPSSFNSDSSLPSTPASSHAMIGTDSLKAAFESSSEPETPRAKKNWINSFEIPSSFSPAVKSNLKDKLLSPNCRNEFTRDICSAMRVHTLFPSKTEREHVCLMVVKKYPFLADKLGTGIGSWQEAIKNRFKNIRKTKRPAGAKSLNLENTVPAKKAKKARSDILPFPAGETSETCIEHVKTLKNEMKKPSNRSATLIKDLMDITFPYRREGIVTESVVVKSLLLLYPALQLVSELKNEFGRAIGDKNIVRVMAEKFKGTYQAKIIKLALEKKLMRQLFIEAQDQIEEAPDKKAEIEETIAVLVLPSLFKEKKGADSTSVIKICSDDESLDEEIEVTSTPRLIGSGEVGQITPLYLVAEGVVIAKLNNMGLSTALALLVGCFYIFNMEYPKKSKNLFLFLEAVLLENTNDAKKRVFLQKIMQELV